MTATTLEGKQRAGFGALFGIGGGAIVAVALVPMIMWAHAQGRLGTDDYPLYVAIGLPLLAVLASAGLAGFFEHGKNREKDSGKNSIARTAMVVSMLLCVYPFVHWQVHRAEYNHLPDWAFVVGGGGLAVGAIALFIAIERTAQESDAKDNEWHSRRGDRDKDD